MKKFLLIVGVIVAVLFVVDTMILKDKGLVGGIGKYEAIQNVSELPIGIREGERAPDFKLEDLQGNIVALSDYKGTPVFLNFWASWCGPCKAEMPFMQKVYEERKSNEFEIIAVNSTTSEKNINNVGAFIEEYGLTFITPLDKKGGVSHQYEILGFPTSFFIDSEGVIRKKALGPLTEAEIKDILKRLP